MDSRTSCRRAATTALAVAVSLGVFMPVAAQADGTAVAGAAPGETATQAVSAPRAVVKETVVPVVRPDEAPSAASEGVVAELPKTDTDGFGMVGVTWKAGGLAYGVTVEVRTRTEGQWSDWTTLEVEQEDGGLPGTEPLWVGEADGVAARVSSELGTPQGVKIATIDPGEDTGTAEDTASDAAWSGPADGVARATATANPEGTPGYTAKPTIISRSAWGATAGTSCSAPATGSSTRGVILHHSAGSNSYAKSDSKALVRGIQAYHVKSRGWCDIGYNFLVDKYGQIFEGRRGGTDKAVRAAHSGNGEVNTYTMGVSMMGNYDTVKPTTALKDAVVKLVGWRVGTTFMKAKGTYKVKEGNLTLNRIAGHRNVLATACPGKYGYAWLTESGGLRDRVETYVSKYSTPTKTLASKLGTSYTGEVYAGENPVAIGRKTRFSKLDIYWSEGTGARAVTGITRTEYGRLKNEQGALGLPTVDYASISSKLGGTRFQKGTIYRVTQSDGSAKALGVHGPIDTVYRSLGQGTGKLGVPTKAVYTEKSGVLRANFAKGYIRHTSSSNTTVAYDSSGKALSTSTTPPAGSTTPKAPTGLKATTTTSTATLSWAASAGATKYDVCLFTYRTATSCWKTLSGVAGTSTTVKDLVPTAGDDYFFRVRASNGSKTSTYSAGMTVIDLRLAPPTGLKATTTSSSAALSWSATPHATTYDVCLFTNADATSCWKTISGVAGTKTTVDKLVPTGGKDYFFRVRARDAGATSYYSAGMTGFDLATSNASADTATVPSSRELKLQGHGYGHGIGMSQYGAQGAAKQGKGFSHILWYYYRGTQFATKTGSIRVLLSKATSSTVEVAGGSGITFTRPGTSVKLKLPTTSGGKTVSRWRITPVSGKTSSSQLQWKASGGSWVKHGSAWTGDAQFEASQVRLMVPGGALVSYRGAIRSAIPKAGSGSRDVLNVLSIEDYVRGVVAAEMPSSWHTEALKAQAVAARTYGVRSMNASRYYDICDTTSCQVYRGVAGETKATDTAIAGTKGQILTFEGKPALTQFSSSSGGWSAAGSQSYLASRADEYDDWSGNGVHDWTFTVKASTLEKAYPKIGTLKSLKVTKRSGGGDWGGRVETVVLTGSRASTTLTGPTFRFAVGLRSAWFRFA